MGGGVVNDAEISLAQLLPQGTGSNESFMSGAVEETVTPDIATAASSII